MAFVGPSAEAIQEEQRRSMIEDVSALLARHFAEGEISEVLQHVHQLFERRWTSSGATSAASTGRAAAPASPRSSASKKHLH